MELLLLGIGVIGIVGWEWHVNIKYHIPPGSTFTRKDNSDFTIQIICTVRTIVIASKISQDGTQGDSFIISKDELFELFH